VIVGAPGHEGESKIAGHAYVFSGKDGTLLRTLQGERVGDEFGSTVAGRSEGEHQYLVVGAPRAGPGTTGVCTCIWMAPRSRSSRSRQTKPETALGRMFVSVVGDLDGDGVSDNLCFRLV